MTQNQIGFWVAIWAGLAIPALAFGLFGQYRYRRMARISMRIGWVFVGILALALIAWGYWSLWYYAYGGGDIGTR